MYPMLRHLLIFAFAASAVAQTTNPVLKDLQSDDWKTRQTAINKLIERGDAAKPEIEEILKTTSDPTVQSDLQAALKQIAENQRFGPTLITAEFNDVAPKEVFAQLSKITGIDFHPGYEGVFNGRPGGITASYKAAPFWPTVLDLCKKTNVFVQNNGGSGRRMVLYNGNNTMFDGPGYSTGAFYIIASSINRNHSISYGSNARSSSLAIQLSVLAEPKLHLLRLLNPAIVEEGTDDLGNSLVPSYANRGGGWSSGSQIWCNMTADLREPEKLGTKIPKLKGYVRAVVVKDQQHIEMSQDDKEFSRDLSGVQVKISPMVVSAQNVTLKIEATSRPNSKILEYLGDSSNGNSMSVTDAEGKVLDYAGGSSSRSNNKFEMTVNYRSSDNKPIVTPVKLSFDMPVSTKEMKVPFEFSNLQLP